MNVLKTHSLIKSTGHAPMLRALLRRGGWMGLLFSVAIVGVARAAEPEWPSKPVRIVSPYAAGGVGDTLFRLFSNSLDAKFNQRFIIDNKTGAAGNIGTAEVVNAKPDGYTFVIAPTANFAVNQHLFSNLGFDPVTQLEPVITISEAPLIAVTPLLETNSLKELANQIVQGSGKFNFGSPGSGSPSHLAGVSFAHMSSDSLQHIGYRGGPPMVMALLSGDVQVAFPTLTTVSSQLKSGKLKALAVLSRQRISDLPNLPTVAEAGFADLLFGNWWVIAGPKGLDPKIAARLSAEIKTLMNDPSVKAKLIELGQTPLAYGPQESAQFIKSESARFKNIIEKNAIKLDQ
jgi:tripartite-type tricarboxylate transporter receptor subunit TctC